MLMFNRFLPLDFNDFNFKNNSPKIKAEEFVPGANRVYKFDKR